ncbi:putative FERM and PDZ domain-containing protein 4-like [Scophthalmus maximus]|nr:putative FERM and PDZ domain-containing protein 4-like [Scophthalmus maximus]
MDLGDGPQEEKLDSSPSASSDSSWTSFDCSTDLTSVSSDQISTPVSAQSGCALVEDQSPKKSPSVKVSSEMRTRKVAWRETSFLGNDE